MANIRAKYTAVITGAGLTYTFSRITTHEAQPNHARFGTIVATMDAPAATEYKGTTGANSDGSKYLIIIQQLSDT
jgi:hypothetical protein